MSTSAYSALLVAVMSIVTILLRAAPFLVFKKKAPAYVMYLGKVLPAAIIGMLVVYCLKDIVQHDDHWNEYYIEIESTITDLLAGYPVNRISHIGSTAIVYMLLTQLVF